MPETVHELLRAAMRTLPGVEGRRDATLLLCHALGVSEAWLIAHAQDPVDPAQSAGYRALVDRRAHGEPVAYLVGVRGFHAIELHVTPDVLIPRPETELLVELALARIPADADCEVADLGTGSGAIALALARARPRVRILATDASAAALAVAQSNAQRLGLAGNVRFVLGNWCAALGDARLDGIVSNPPYVPERDPHLACGDLRFEPRGALASGVDGLDAIRTIVRDAPSHLRAGGWLLLEHGLDQGAAVRALLDDVGYVDAFTERDLEGRERASSGGTA